MCGSQFSLLWELFCFKNQKKHIFMLYFWELCSACLSVRNILHLVIHLCYLLHIEKQFFRFSQSKDYLFFLFLFHSLASFGMSEIIWPSEILSGRYVCSLCPVRGSGITITPKCG